MKTKISLWVLLLILSINAFAEESTTAQANALTGLLDQVKSKLNGSVAGSGTTADNETGKDLITTGSIKNSVLYSWDVAGVKLGMTESEAKKALTASIKGLQFQDIVLEERGSSVRGGFHAFKGIKRKSYHPIEYEDSIAVYIAEGKVWGVAKSVFRNKGMNNYGVVHEKFAEAVHAKYPEAVVPPAKTAGSRLAYFYINTDGSVSTPDTTPKPQHCTYIGDDWSPRTNYSAPWSVTVYPNCPGVFVIRGNILEKEGIPVVINYLTFLIDGEAGYNWTKNYKDAAINLRKKQIIEGGKAEF